MDFKLMLSRWRYHPINKYMYLPWQDSFAVPVWPYDGLFWQSVRISLSLKYQISKPFICIIVSPEKSGNKKLTKSISG